LRYLNKAKTNKDVDMERYRNRDEKYDKRTERDQISLSYCVN